MWTYLKTIDMQTWVKNTPKALYWKLASQSRKRVPMLTVSYNQLKKKYINK
jgi:hypothetical protein